jgi:hypothetical protein
MGVFVHRFLHMSHSRPSTGSMQFPKQIVDTLAPVSAATDSPTTNPTVSPNTFPDTSPNTSPVTFPTASPTASRRTPRPTNPSPKQNMTDLGMEQDPVTQQQNDLKGPQIPAVKGDSTLSVGAIIGIAIAVATVLACFFYFEARRRNLARQVGILAAVANKNNGSREEKPSFEVETAKPSVAMSYSQKSSSRSSTRPSKSALEALEAIREAVNKADWDNIYRLASQLAEEDEAQSLPGLTIAKERRRRGHLNAEDQERTKTLDDLMARGDWTGVAVTAALYAGESGSSYESTHNLPVSSKTKRTRQSLHHDEDDWKQVHVVSLRERSNSSHASSLSYGSAPAGDIEQGQKNVSGLTRSLNEALSAGNWAQVNYYATKIKEVKGVSGESSFVSDDISNAKDMILASGSSRVASNVSAATTDTDMSRRQTIEKLMRAEKWKGVSMMANLYELESKQQEKSSLVKATRGTKTTKRPPRSLKKPNRTKELCHSDRVAENIVGFRQEDDALVRPYGGR